jgi:hypothetical protein
LARCSVAALLRITDAAKLDSLLGRRRTTEPVKQNSQVQNHSRTSKQQQTYIHSHTYIIIHIQSKLHLVAATLEGASLRLAALSPRCSDSPTLRSWTACLVTARACETEFTSQNHSRTSNNTNIQTYIHTYIHTYTV